MSKQTKTRCLMGFAFFAFISMMFVMVLVAETTTEAKPNSNPKYGNMTCEQAAKAFFEACSVGDWTEAEKFCTITKGVKDYLNGVKILKVDAHFTNWFSLINGAHMVPYEIELKSGKIKKHLIKMHWDSTNKSWFVGDMAIYQDPSDNLWYSDPDYKP